MIFRDPKQFSDRVAHEAEMKGVGFMETVLNLCEFYGIDPSAVGELITPPLKAAIQREATALHFFKQTADTESSSLPFE